MTDDIKLPPWPKIDGAPQVWFGRDDVLRYTRAAVLVDREVRAKIDVLGLGNQQSKKLYANLLIKDMTMLIKRMAYQLEMETNDKADSDLADIAYDYLHRHDLDGEVMRDEGEKE